MMTTAHKHRATFKRVVVRAGLYLVAASAALWSARSRAQIAPAPPAKVPVYDAVSIKLNKSGSGSSRIDSYWYRFSATNISLKSLLEQAYGIKPDLISGVDGPTASARFDIEGKVVEPDPALMNDAPPGLYRALVLGMLQEYFHLKAHTELKTLAVYDLELAKDGPKFKEAATIDAKDAGTSIHNMEMEAKSVTMASLAASLSNQVQRNVVDRTGLTGTYDLKLKWSRDNGAALDDGTKDGPPVIFTALKEQLGLKLEPAKGPVDTLVIDHIEMPPEN